MSSVHFLKLRKIIYWCRDNIFFIVHYLLSKLFEHLGFFRLGGMLKYGLTFNFTGLDNGAAGNKMDVDHPLARGSHPHLADRKPAV